MRTSPITRQKPASALPSPQVESPADKLRLSYLFNASRHVYAKMAGETRYDRKTKIMTGDEAKKKNAKLLDKFRAAFSAELSAGVAIGKTKSVLIQWRVIQRYVDKSRS